MASKARGDRRHQISEKGYEEPGFFTWDLAVDTVYSDSLVARLFDFDQNQAERGLPIVALMDRLHDDDRKRVARSLHEAVVTGEPFREEYRTVHRNGSVVTVLEFGRCFRNKEGEPSYYVGIICPMPSDSGLSRGLAWHCLAAYDLAVREGNGEAAAKLMDALLALEPLAAARENRH